MGRLKVVSWHVLEGVAWRCWTLDFVPFVQLVRFLGAGQWGVVGLVAVSTFRLTEWGALIFRRFKVWCGLSGFTSLGWDKHWNFGGNFGLANWGYGFKRVQLAVHSMAGGR